MLGSQPVRGRQDAKEATYEGDSDRDDVRTTTIQPIGSHDMGNGWSLEMSEMMFNYDFNFDEWSTLPLGVRIGRLTKFGKLPVRFYGDVECNFADSGVAPIRTLHFAFVPLL